MKIAGMLIVLALVAVGAFFIFGNRGLVLIKDKEGGSMLNVIKEVEDIKDNIEESQKFDVDDTEQSQVEIKELSINAGEFFFTPQNIIFNAGEKVKLTLKNIGIGTHDLRIENTNIKTKIISSGQTDVIEFIAPEAGKYVIYCSLPGHREAGMVGELIIN